MSNYVSARYSLVESISHYKKVEDEFRDRALDLFGSLVEEYNKSVYPEYADVFGKGSEHLVLKYIDPEALKRYSENKEKE